VPSKFLQNVTAPIRALSRHFSGLAHIFITIHIRYTLPWRYAGIPVQFLALCGDFGWGQFRQDDVVRANSNFRRAGHLHLRLPDIRVLLHYHEKVKQPMATRQQPSFLAVALRLSTKPEALIFSLRFDAPVQSSSNLVGGNSAARPKGSQIPPSLPLSG